MKNILFAILLSLLGFATQAQEKKGKNAKHEIAVKGNCEMCKKRIEKAAFSVSGVKSAIWNADNHTLVVIVNEQKSAVLEIEKAVSEVGHDTENIKATEENYSNLHNCCSYKRD